MTEHRVIRENADSIEIGTAGKGGAVKVYLDFNDVEVSKVKVKKALALRKWASVEIEAP